MRKIFLSLIALLTLAAGASPAWADAYSDTIDVFKKAEKSGSFFQNAYGYAVFPTIGKESPAAAVGANRQSDTRGRSVLRMGTPGLTTHRIRRAEIRLAIMGRMGTPGRWRRAREAGSRGTRRDAGRYG